MMAGLNETLSSANAELGKIAENGCQGALQNRRNNPRQSSGLELEVLPSSGI